MGVISGINCTVADVSSLARWKISSRNMTPEFATSDAPGGMGRAAGNEDWRGVYKAYGYSPLATHYPGETFDFKGNVDENYGVSAASIVDRVTITAPIEPGGLITTLVEFSNNDAAGLVPAAAAGSAGTDPAIYSSITRKVSFSGDISVRNWRLVLTCRNRPYVDTDTAGRVRRNRGNIDASFEFGVYQDDMSALPDRGSIAIAQFYVTDALYWELTWGIIQEIPDWGADHEGAENVAGTVRGALTLQDGTSIGTIKVPGGATMWP